MQQHPQSYQALVLRRCRRGGRGLESRLDLVGHDDGTTLALPVDGGLDLVDPSLQGGDGVVRRGEVTRRGVLGRDGRVARGDGVVQLLLEVCHVGRNGHDGLAQVVHLGVAVGDEEDALLAGTLVGVGQTLEGRCDRTELALELSELLVGVGEIGDEQELAVLVHLGVAVGDVAHGSRPGLDLVRGETLEGLQDPDEELDHQLGRRSDGVGGSLQLGHDGVALCAVRTSPEGEDGTLDERAGVDETSDLHTLHELADLAEHVVLDTDRDGRVVRELLDEDDDVVLVAVQLGLSFFTTGFSTLFACGHGCSTPCLGAGVGREFPGDVFLQSTDGLRPTLYQSMVSVHADQIDLQIPIPYLERETIV